MSLAESQGWRCCYCGTRMTDEPGLWHSATIDHIVPRCNGGRSGENRENLVIACRRCNEARRTRDALTFYENVLQQQRNGGYLPSDLKTRRTVRPKRLRAAR